MYLENLRRYWREHCAHVAVGALIGWLGLDGLPLAALVCTRQGLEYLKRDDTPGMDLAYHVGGCAVGVVAGTVWRMVV